MIADLIEVLQQILEQLIIIGDLLQQILEGMC